jgi:hypothetical protein
LCPAFSPASPTAAASEARQRPLPQLAVRHSLCRTTAPILPPRGDRFGHVVIVRRRWRHSTGQLHARDGIPTRAMILVQPAGRLLETTARCPRAPVSQQPPSRYSRFDDGHPSPTSAKPGVDAPRVKGQLDHHQDPLYRQDKSGSRIKEMDHYRWGYGLGRPSWHATALSQDGARASAGREGFQKRFHRACLKTRLRPPLPQKPRS